MEHLPESIQDDSIERQQRKDTRLQVARLGGLVVLAGLVAAFVIQNSQTVSVRFWLFTRHPPLIFVVIGCLVIGGGLGYIAGHRRGSRKKPRRFFRRELES